MKILPIILIIMSIAVSSGVMVWIFSDKYDRLAKQIVESESKTRDSLIAQLKIIRSDRDSLQNKILNLSKTIEQNDIKLTYQIQKFKNETFKNLKSYSDSNNIQLLKRLLSN